MSHGAPGFEDEDTNASPAALPTPLAVLERMMAGLNRVLAVFAAVAILVAALVLTEAVLARNIAGDSSEWQEEVTVFLLIGAMFLSMSAVQARRGHIGIDALASILSPGANRIRQRLVDLASLAFTVYFAWKCFQLLRESIVDDEHTMSTWGPPLWIPYSLMASGMVLLAVQVALQTVVGFLTHRVPKTHPALPEASPILPEMHP